MAGHERISSPIYAAEVQAGALEEGDKLAGTESRSQYDDGDDNDRDALVGHPPNMSSKPLEAMGDVDACQIHSPSPSLLDGLVYEELRTGRGPSRGGARRRISQSPTPPKTLKGRLKATWVRNKGLALVMLAQVFGTLMNVATRLLETEGNGGKGMHPFQILFARMSITTLCATLYMYYKRTPDFPLGKPGLRLILCLRGVGGFFGVFGLYYSLMYLPLADATVITFLAPCIACWACSHILKEPFTRMEQIAALVSLFGVVLIARPTSFFSATRGGEIGASGDAGGIVSSGNATLHAGNVTLPAYDVGRVTPQQRAAGVGVALIGVMGAATAYTTMRWIGQRAHPLISVNYFSALCCIISLSALLTPVVAFLLPATPREWFLLLSLGACGFVMQFLLAAGLAYERSSRATNMIYSQMLFALLFDKLVFGTTMSALSAVGSSLILGAAIYVAVQKGKSKEKGGGDAQSGRILDEEVQLRLVDGPERDCYEDEEEEEEDMDDGSSSTSRFSEMGGWRAGAAI